MNFLYDWLRQIVVLIFIGTILEMLLPSNRLKKYVHFVFGLLFLLLLGQPIFYLLKTDITEHISTFEHYLMQDESELEETKQQVEKQKEDIQAEQVAYIWNELAQNLINEANDTMQQQYGLQINQVSFENEFADRDEIGDFSKIIVLLEPVNEREHNSPKPIEPIIINPQEKSRQLHEDQNEKAIEATLRNTWQLEDDVTIEIIWEGGAL